jgi:hypothetical protein
MRTTHRYLLPVLALTVVVAVRAGAQSPADIFDRMLADYSSRIEGVDDYTLVQETMGFETVLYFEKEIVDGRPVLRLKSTTAMGNTVDADDEDAGFNEIYEVGHQLAQHAEYAGREEVDGRQVHVLLIENLDQIDFGRGTVDEDSDFTPRTGKLFIDTDMSIPRRMEFEGDMKTDDGTANVTSIIHLQDYREAEGMLVPYRTVVEMHGLSEAVDPEMRQQYEEMKKQLAEMPESQRAMAEQMMKGQLEQIENMMQGDAMRVEMLVTDVRVNTGPPSN